MPRIKIKSGLHVNYPLFLSDVNETKFSLQTASPVKIRPGEPSCSTWADGRTSMNKLIVAFRNFAKPPNAAILVGGFQWYLLVFVNLVVS